MRPPLGRLARFAIVCGLSAFAATGLLTLSGCGAGSRGYAPTLPVSAQIPRGAVEASTTRLAGAVLRALPRRTDSRGLVFDEGSAIREASAIAAIGVRRAGSAKERAAARHIAGRLRSLGLEPRYEWFPLPGGGRSLNVIVTIQGVRDDRAVILGGHMDTKSPSPGANDNASGCGVLLELASALAESPPPVTVDIVFWGSEEVAFANSDGHHFGSRHHARTLTAQERERYVGVICVDMVGVGSEFLVRTMGRGPKSLSNLMLADARRDRVALSYLRDPGRSGWSDHEPYELLGMPVAWLEWHDDPFYHTSKDTADRLQRRPMRVTGEFVTRFVYRLDDARIARIDAR